MRRLVALFALKAFLIFTVGTSFAGADFSRKNYYHLRPPRFEGKILQEETKDISTVLKNINIKIADDKLIVQIDPNLKLTCNSDGDSTGIILINEAGKELHLRLVKEEGEKFLKIGNSVYKINKDIIHLQDIFNISMGWLGNAELVDFFSMEQVLAFTKAMPALPSPAISISIYNYDAKMMEPLSSIVQPTLFPTLPMPQQINQAREYLRTNKYNPGNSYEGRMQYIHNLFLLSKTRVAEGINYNQVIEDRILTTNIIEDIALRGEKNDQEVIKELVDILAIFVVKEIPQKENEKSYAKLTGPEKKKVATHEFFQITDPEEDFPKLNDIFEELMRIGEIKPYYIISIKNHTSDTYISYMKFLREISAKYNGNITFIVTIEQPPVKVEIPVKNDLPGSVTAFQRAADLLGEDFFHKEFVGMISDGGMKTRGALITSKQAGQFSKASLPRVRKERIDFSTFLEMNILTIGTGWLLLKNWGSKNGKRIIMWAASDGIIRFGIMKLGDNPIAEMPDEFRLGASGQEVVLLTKEDMEFLNDKAALLIKQEGIKVLLDDAMLRAIYKDEKEILARLLMISKLVKDTIRNYDLTGKGIFLVNSKGEMTDFLEKANEETILLKAYKEGNGAVVMNLFFLVGQSGLVYELFVKRLWKEKATLKDGTKLPAGRADPDASIFRTIFGGFFLPEQERRGKIARQAIIATGIPKDKERLHGINYGLGSIVADIGHLRSYAEMWTVNLLNEMRKKYRGDRLDNIQIPDNVKIIYEGQDITKLSKEKRSEFNFLIKDVVIVGPADRREVCLKIGFGSVIARSIIKLDEDFEVTDGSLILDSNVIASKIKFMGERAIVVFSHNPEIMDTYDLKCVGKKYFNKYEPVDRLIVYGGETTATLSIKGRRYVVRIPNIDYKKELYKIYGGESVWGLIQDKLKIPLKFDRLWGKSVKEVVKDEKNFRTLVQLIFSEDIPEGVLNEVVNEVVEKGEKVEKKDVINILRSYLPLTLIMTDLVEMDAIAEEVIKLVNEKGLREGKEYISGYLRINYRRAFYKEIDKFLENQDWSEIKDKPYFEVLYNLAVAMHPAVLGVEGMSSYTDTNEAKSQLINLPNFGGFTFEQVKLETDTVAMTEETLDIRSCVSRPNDIKISELPEVGGVMLGRSLYEEIKKVLSERGKNLDLKEIIGEMVRIFKKHDITDRKFRAVWVGLVLYNFIKYGELPRKGVREGFKDRLDDNIDPVLEVVRNNPSLDSGKLLREIEDKVFSSRLAKDEELYFLKYLLHEAINSYDNIGGSGIVEKSGVKEDRGSAEILSLIVAAPILVGISYITLVFNGGVASVMTFVGSFGILVKLQTLWNQNTVISDSGRDFKPVENNYRFKSLLTAI